MIVHLLAGLNDCLDCMDLQVFKLRFSGIFFARCVASILPFATVGSAFPY